MKKTFIVILSIISVICLAFDGWWLYVWKFAPAVLISNTYEIGLQTLEDESDTRYFAEINYYSNKNKNGLECFEIKFNYLLDENKTAFYSQGIQLVANNPSASIGFTFADDNVRRFKNEDKHVQNWYSGKDYYGVFGSWYANGSSSYYNYMSGDDYETTLISTNPISQSSAFKIEIGDELYEMKFRNVDTGHEKDSSAWFKMASDDNYVKTYEHNYNFYLVFGYSDMYDCYSYYDIYYFVNLLYSSVQSVPAGTNSAVVFEFADIFDYYAPDETTGKYTEKVDDVANAKIVNQVQSYYALKINKSDDGMRRAKTDSIFHCIQGNCNYNTTGNYLDVEYFYGRAVINVDETDFKLVPTDVVNHFKLELSDKFKNYYQNYADKIVLDVNIDMTYFDELGITIDGFTNSAFTGFDIFQNNLEGVA